MYKITSKNQQTQKLICKIIVLDFEKKKLTKVIKKFNSIY